MAGVGDLYVWYKDPTLALSDLRWLYRARLQLGDDVAAATAAVEHAYSPEQREAFTQLAASRNEELLTGDPLVPAP